ncbi:MAG: hypothetical protein M1821_006719 [Bathelium mastoideum]|nr:MAG: hypothetical protein M1821_006719 [Bathelium mastoideum]
MDVSFNVSGAGPLSQISTHIIDFSTAIHLATGAIGWWKARGRGKTLIEGLSAAKASLVPTSTFDHPSYRVQRSGDRLTGLAAQNGTLEQFPESIESTSVSNDAGIDCLRALTTSLLCLYSVRLTSVILADLIPYALLQPDQEDKFPVFEKALFASLRDWVASIAEEEDHNMLRNQLLETVARQQNQMKGGGDGMEMNHGAELNELGLLLGCLRWILTPLHKREHVYPTRSIRVWTTAVIMSELAFSVSGALLVVGTKEQYEAVVSERATGDKNSDVILVAASVGTTDPWMRPGPADPLRIRPQVIPILSIPYSAFGALRKRYVALETKRLTEICQFSFKSARDAVQTPDVVDRKVLLKTLSPKSHLVQDSHKALIGLWSPQLSFITGPMFEHCVPKILDGNWEPSAIDSFIHRQIEGSMLSKVDLVRNSYTLAAIVLGAIYGACSSSMFAISHDIGSELSIEEIDVAFSPDIVTDGTLFRWASTLGKALAGVLEPEEWMIYMFEVITGSKNTLSKTADAKITSNVLSQDRSVFGAQANGILAVSQFILDPMSARRNPLTFIIGTGRILNFPVDENGYIRGSEHEIPSMDLSLSPGPFLEDFDRNLSPTTPTLRLDAEPHWLGDPQVMCFVVRHKGSVLATLNIQHLLNRIIYDRIRCCCERICQGVRLRRSQCWREVTLQELVGQGDSIHRMNGGIMAKIRDPRRILVDVHENAVCQAYALGVVSSRRVIMCPCVRCAYDKVQQQIETNPSWEESGVALIIGG